MNFDLKFDQTYFLRTSNINNYFIILKKKIITNFRNISIINTKGYNLLLLFIHIICIYGSYKYSH